MSNNKQGYEKGQNFGFHSTPYQETARSPLQANIDDVVPANDQVSSSIPVPRVLTIKQLTDGRSSNLFASNLTEVDEGSPWLVKSLDPQRDLDMSNCLRACCGCLPCCCCLYNGMSDDSSEGSYENTPSRAKTKTSHNPFPVNKNVFIVLLITLLHNFAESMWSGSILVIFFYILDGGHHNITIGYLEAIRGFSTVLFTLCAEKLSKKFGFINTARLGGFGIFSFASLFIIMATLSHSDSPPHPSPSFLEDSERARISRKLFDPSLFEVNEGNSISTILAYYAPVMVLWGVTSSAINGPLQLIFKHSILKESTNQYSILTMLIQMSAKTYGPLLGLIIFATTNNQWKLYVLKAIIVLGMCLELVVALLCLFFREEWTLPENSLEDMSKEEEACRIQTSGIATSENVADESSNLPSNKERTCCSICRLAPFLYALSNILISFGGGMTMKFFPLFFKNIVHMTPVAVQTIYSILPLFVLVMTLLMTKAVSTFGAGNTLLTIRFLGTVGIFLLSASEKWFHNEPFPIAIIFIIRSVLMNATSIVEQEFSSEFITQKHATTWKRLEGLNVLAWTGSAIVGGILIDEHSYCGTFFITGIIQSIALIPLLITVLYTRYANKRKVSSNEHHENGQGEV